MQIHSDFYRVTLDSVLLAPAQARLDDTAFAVPFGPSALPLLPAALVLLLTVIASYLIFLCVGSDLDPEQGAASSSAQADNALAPPYAPATAQIPPYIRLEIAFLLPLTLISLPRLDDVKVDALPSEKAEEALILQPLPSSNATGTTTPSNSVSELPLTLKGDDGRLQLNPAGTIGNSARPFGFPAFLPSDLAFLSLLLLGFAG